MDGFDQAVPKAVFAEDQPFRLTSLAFAQPHDRAERDLILDALRSEAANVTVNNLWVLGWVGGYDKLSDPAFCVQIFREPKCRAGRHSRGTGLEAAASQYYLQTTEAVQFLPSCFGPTGSTPPLKAAGHLSKPGAPPPAPGFFVLLDQERAGALIWLPMATCCLKRSMQRTCVA